jgi:hypothetical protein
MRRYTTICILTFGIAASIGYVHAQALTPAQLNVKAKIEGVKEGLSSAGRPS